MNRPSVSIIVLTCNQVDYTLALLASLSRWMGDNPDSELIIVDNGSKDNTRERIYGSGYVAPSQLRYFYNQRNLGVAAGRNIGLKKADRDLILILDNDTEVTGDAIDALRDYLEGNPGCGLVAPALISASGVRQESAKPFPGIGIKMRHVLRRKNTAESEKKAMESLHPFYVIGACQMFRRSVIERIGLLDEKIFYGPEDADWCMRIRAAGGTIDYLPAISITHHWQRATTRSPFSRLSRLHIRALLFFYRKHRRFL